MSNSAVLDQIHYSAESGQGLNFAQDSWAKQALGVNLVTNVDGLTTDATVNETPFSDMVFLRFMHMKHPFLTVCSKDL